MGSIEDGKIVNNGLNIELTKEEEFETNPIQVDKVLETSVGKVGYLMYNQFVIGKNSELNQVFGDFKNQGVNELIVDLRYNGGGSVRMCIELASMITGQFAGEIFSKEQWNSKLTEYLEDRFGADSLQDEFVDTLTDSNDSGESESINSLSLNRVFILTTSNSASASELLINSLSSYIDVVHIGEQTRGKNVGSITVYDYIDNEGTKNPDHKYAMQPIVLKIANKDGFADYANGLEPDASIDEDIKNLGTLGDEKEPLLETALNLISGTAKLYLPKSSFSKQLLINDPILTKVEGMYIDKNWFQDQGKR
jgi:C-terminal processing protease CtpA/Prc